MLGRKFTQGRLKSGGAGCWVEVVGAVRDMVIHFQQISFYEKGWLMLYIMRYVAKFPTTKTSLRALIWEVLSVGDGKGLRVCFVGRSNLLVGTI